jgi:hypothetical protein
MLANLLADRRGRYEIIDRRTAKKQRELSSSACPFFKRILGNPTEKFDRCTLVSRRTRTNSVFLGYFPEQERYRDEIREFNGDMWVAFITISNTVPAPD